MGLGIVLLVSVSIISFLYNRRMKPFVHREFALDTLVEIQIWGPDAKDAAKAAMAEIRRIEGLLSRYQPGSVLVRLAESGGGEVDKAIYHVLGQALEIASASGGAYDPTVGELSLLWQRAREKEELPEREEILKALEGVGWQQVKLIPPNKVMLPPGLQLDLGGAAKGYAVDRALEVLKGQGIERALVNAGGQIGILGEAPRGLWRVGVKDPREAGLLTVLEVKEGAVSTSGDYQRFFISGGRRYHHLVDPTTGYPAWDCQSATVVAETGLLADLLSTACFIMGPEMGMALVERYGAEALVVDKDGRVHATGDLCYEPVKGRD